MAKKATTLHDNLGNDLLPVTNASITFMDNGNSVQAEINDLKEKTQYNKGHYTTEQELLTAYPNGIQNPQLRKGWYAIVGETDSVWIWDIEGNKWSNSGTGASDVDSVNGLYGEVILTGGNINATATINDTSKTELINKHLTDIYSELDNKVDLDSSQLITGTKVFTETIGLANTSEGTVDQIKHINSNFLITSGNGQNLLNIDEGLGKISAFNRELAYEDEIQQIQGDYAQKSELNNYLPLTAGSGKVLTGDLYVNTNIYQAGKQVANAEDIPTVNNGTLTIQQDGTTLGTFTANQSGDTTIDIPAGGGGFSFTNILNLTGLSVSGTSSTGANSVRFSTYTVSDLITSEIANQMVNANLVRISVNRGMSGTYRLIATNSTAFGAYFSGVCALIGSGTTLQPVFFTLKSSFGIVTIIISDTTATPANITEIKIDIA